MHSELNAQLAFHLTGVKSGTGLEPMDGLALRPALLAGYADLTALRYDFPLVFMADGVRPLSALVDEALKDVTDERVRAQALRREREIRARVAGGLGGKLSALWNVEPKLAVDGELADCDAALPGLFFERAWAKVRDAKAGRFQGEAERLIARLAEILAADYVQSDEGRSAEALAKSLAARDDTFDTAALSRLLAKAIPERRLDAARRKRISWALAVLKARPSESFIFDNCAAALRALQDRRPALIDVAKALSMARLEAAGEYVASVHDAVFAEFSDADAGTFPAYFVHVDARELRSSDNACLGELLASGLPVKILVQHDDILDWSTAANAPAFGAQTRSLAGLALGLNGVYVVQSSASNLFQMSASVARAMEYGGPALFNVFRAHYLVAAAAMESRAFPAFSYDPTAEHGARFSLENNPQAERDWPVHPLSYEDVEHQRVMEDTEFGLMDFVAFDARYAGYFARIPQGQVNGLVPSLAMVDADNRLQKVIVSDTVAREARRCLDAWHELQARVKKAEPVPVAEPAAAPAPASAAAAAPAPEAPKAPASDAPYIETPRCTTCEECVKINPRLFVYDSNKQAYLADLNAGSYKDLVEAAESCQVSIIHPGKPRNPDEPGLAELIERAQPFL